MGPAAAAAAAAVGLMQALWRPGALLVVPLLNQGMQTAEVAPAGTRLWLVLAAAAAAAEGLVVCAGPLLLLVVQHKVL